MNLRQLLRKFDLSPKEIEIYIIAASLGSQPASVIAEKANFNRVTTYVALKRIAEKGMARTMIIRGMQFFEVEPMLKLSLMCERKRSEWNKLKEELEVEAARMKERVPYQSSQSVVRSYIGMESIKTMLSEFQKGKDFHIFLSDHMEKTKYERYVAESFLPKHIQRENTTGHIYGSAIRIPHIIARLAEAHEFMVHYCDDNHCRIDIFMMESKKCAIVSQHEHSIQGIYMEGELITESLIKLITNLRESATPSLTRK